MNNTYTHINPAGFLKHKKSVLKDNIKQKTQQKEIGLVFKIYLHIKVVWIYGPVTADWVHPVIHVRLTHSVHCSESLRRDWGGFGLIQNRHLFCTNMSESSNDWASSFISYQNLQVQNEKGKNIFQDQRFGGKSSVKTAKYKKVFFLSAFVLLSGINILLCNTFHF